MSGVISSSNTERHTHKKKTNQIEGNIYGSLCMHSKLNNKSKVLVIVFSSSIIQRGLPVLEKKREVTFNFTSLN